MPRYVVTLLSLFALCGQAFSVPFTSETICPGQSKILSENYIGKDHNVKMTTLSCAQNASIVEPRRLSERQTTTTPLNVCGAKCNTNCFLPAGGGPDPNDCHVITDALKFEAQNTGAIFVIPNGNSTTNATNPVVLQFSSCKTFFLNQDLGPLAYCRTDWASLVDILAFNCQATQNAHGGNCVAADQRWFVQVQTA